MRLGGSGGWADTHWRNQISYACALTAATRCAAEAVFHRSPERGVIELCICNPLSFWIMICNLMMCNFWLHRKRKAEEAADEPHQAKAASSDPSVESPPQSRACREATPGETEAADTVRSAARKAAPIGVAEVPPAPPSPLPQETPSRELLPAHEGPILLRILVAEEQKAEGDEPARLAEELQAAARHAAESAEVG